jgi:hypothetical protein
MLGNVSLGTLGLVLGGLLSAIGLVAYFLENATLNLVGFFYGIPLLLGGLALKTTELKPVPYSQAIAPDVLALRNQKATPTQNQIRKDVTRFRYGQSHHLDSSLKTLGLYPRDEECPILNGLREMCLGEDYALVLEFDSPDVPLEVWQQKREKIEKFFGPNVRAEISSSQEHQVDLALIATSDDALQAQ